MKRPTILYDEIDTVFGPKAHDNEEVRGLLNAGHRKGAVAGRCKVIGTKVVTEEIPAYCAVGMAGIGSLPDTILSRCVVIKMRKRKATERVDPFRPRDHEPEGREIGERLSRWIAGITDHLAEARPEMPEGVEDRDADLWEPLLAIADAAGGDWPVMARDAAKKLTQEGRDEPPSLGVKLLKDIRAIWTDGATEMPTADILRLLKDLDESPWDDLRGKAITAHKLAFMLRQYDVTSGKVKSNTLKGYFHADLRDAWDRYLPSSSEASKPSKASGESEKQRHSAGRNADASESKPAKASGKRPGLNDCDSTLDDASDASDGLTEEETDDLPFETEAPF